MDYFLKTTTKEDFIQDLNNAGVEIIFSGDYYQDENMVIDWIGLIPNPVQLDENNEIIGEITYKDGLHVNIRSNSIIDITKFIKTTEVYPQIPYRIFS